jgi:parallel beta-helix repeat protein
MKTGGVLNFVFFAVAFFVLMALPQGVLSAGITISGGNVGIGTDTPAWPLDVVGNINTSGNINATGSLSGGSCSITGAVAAGSASITGNVSADSAIVTGNVTAGSFTGSFSGNGSAVTNVNATTLNGETSSDIINAASDEVRTPISSLPFTISSPGSYYLSGALTSSSNGINVNADNVTIDFSGFTITGPGKYSYTGFGIYMNGRRNVEIKNGTIRGFGLAAIRENSSVGREHRVLYMRIQDNGSNADSYGAISFNGSANFILNCTVTGNACGGINVGSGTTVIGNTAHSNGQIGINAANGSTVSGNTSSYNEADGISASGSSVLIGNTVYHNGRDGISAYDGSTVKNNAASYNTRYGILLGSYDLVDGNTAYNNNTYGGFGNMSSCGTCTMGLNVAT